MKKLVTKPVKNAHKHEDNLLEVMIHNKTNKQIVKQLQPSKNYKKG